MRPRQSRVRTLRDGTTNSLLSEIDQNFSRAHRIVTTSILPIVEQYAKHSEAVWEGSKVRSHNTAYSNR